MKEKLSCTAERTQVAGRERGENGGGGETKLLFPYDSDIIKATAFLRRGGCMMEGHSIPRLMLAAPSSGSGKTTLACGLLRAAQRRGLAPCAFKCGPDYIDPMFHRSVLGVPSRNLDLFFSSEEEVRSRLVSAAQGHGLAVLEGVMGFYDGQGNTDRASSWRLAQATRTPVLLAVRPQGTALTLAALVKGVQIFRTPSQIAGVLLNGCTQRLAELLTPAIQGETGLPVLGYLPQLPGCSIPSRHLGLFTPDEVEDLSAKVDRVAGQLAETANLDQIFALARSAPELEAEPLPPLPDAPDGPLVAVARDEAFCFYYEDNLDELRRAGSRLAFFRPTRDQSLPEGTCGLYLGGGYPELHARALSENRAMGEAVRRAVLDGMPTLAECGGFLYLQSTLEDGEGVSWPMAGVLDGAGFKTSRLQRFGYVTLTAQEDSPYLNQGETVAAHEFHRWDCTRNGELCRARRPSGGEGWNCMVEQGNLLAGFPHLYFPSNPQFAVRFAAACRQYQERNAL